MRKIEAHIIKSSDNPVKKSANYTNSNTENNANFIEPPVDLHGLSELVKNSSILPQCIRAYKNNIAGFGIGVRYKSDDKDTPEAEAEFDRIAEIIELLNMDKPAKEVFENIIEARETYGIAYAEVIRNLAGEVIGIEFIKQTPTVRKTKPLSPFIEAEHFYKDKIVTRPKKFCKYKQEINGNFVYFKEIGDPRIMDKTTGNYGECALENHANEIIEFTVGTETYGTVRWIGQILGVDGSRKAENLNNNYFVNGRHTPLMIMVKGGTLTEDSFAKLQQYMDGIKGEAGQHAFIVLESENLVKDGVNYGENEKPPDVEIHSLASILQRDELFQDYLDNNRKKIQSAFQLPDLYVGYTSDFNRATAQVAQEITEQQIFQPERQSLAWIINNKLLANYKFKYAEAYFKAPDIQNPDDIMKILNVTERAGGLTPNKAKEITYKIYGGVSEDYVGDWADVPLSYAKINPENFMKNAENQLNAQIQKASGGGDTEIAAVMKEVRNLLKAGKIHV